MSNPSRYRGVIRTVDGRWKAERRSSGVLVQRGPFDFEEEAAQASKLMALAIKEGREVPSTAELKAQIPDLSQGRERPMTAYQKRKLAEKSLVERLSKLVGSS